MIPKTKVGKKQNNLITGLGGVASLFKHQKENLKRKENGKDNEIQYLCEPKVPIPKCLCCKIILLFLRTRLAIQRIVLYA